jgi:hypothetical protein
LIVFTSLIDLLFRFYLSFQGLIFTASFELENWRIGELENWRIGEVEKWRSGEVEKWRSGEVKGEKIKYWI